MKRSIWMGLLVGLVAMQAVVSSAADPRGGRRPTSFNRPQLSNDPASMNLYRNTYNRPTVSPYLNLLRPQGFNTSPNYQSLVVPQVSQMRNNQAERQRINSLQRQVNQLNRSQPASASGGIRETGHATQFMNFGQYFNTMGR